MKKQIVSIFLLITLIGFSGCLPHQENDIDAEVKNLIDSIPEVPIEANSQEKSSIQEITDITVVLPISGELSALSNAFLAGMNHALEKINKQGGIDGEEVNLIIEDLICSEESELKDIEKKVSVKQAQFLISGGCSEFINKFASYLDNEKIVNLVAFPNNVADHKYQYIFNLMPSQDILIKQIIEYLINNLNISNINVIYDESFSEIEIGIFEHYFSEQNGTILEKKKIDSLDSKITFDEQFLAKSPQAILALVESPLDAKAIIQELEFLKTSIPLIINRDVLSLLFENKLNILTYSIDTNEEPSIIIPRDFTNLKSYFLGGYDALMMIYNALAKVGLNNNAIRGYLLGMSHQGELISNISYNQKGEILNLNYKFEEFRFSENDEDEIITIPLDTLEGENMTSI